MSTVPKVAGFYWAQWRLADEGTPEGEEQTPSFEWEVVQVVQNSLNSDDTDHLLAAVPGQVKSQRLENFVWAPGGPLPPPCRLGRTGR